jgi:hypothetical protein
MWAALAVGTGAPVTAATITAALGGSRAGREPNVDSDFNAGVARLQRDYFIDTAAAMSTRRRDPFFLVCVDSAVNRGRVEYRSAVRTPLYRPRGSCFQQNILRLNPTQEHAHFTIPDTLLIQYE